MRSCHVTLQGSFYGGSFPTYLTVETVTNLPYVLLTLGNYSILSRKFPVTSVSGASTGWSQDTKYGENIIDAFCGQQYRLLRSIR